MTISETAATLTGPGEPTWFLPKNSDRRLPSSEWGLWTEPVSMAIGIELGERAKTGIVRESRSPETTILQRVRFPEQAMARF